MLLFLRHGGLITCKITDPRKKYSQDLEQGGLEIPCLLLFRGERDVLAKVEKLLSLSEKKISTDIQVCGDEKQEPKDKTDCALPEAKRIKIKVEDTDQKQANTHSFQEVWGTCTGTKIKLFQEDKVLLEGNGQLNDKHINFAQAMLRNQFPQCCGLQNTLLQG